MVVSPPSTPGVQGSRAWVTLVTNPAYVVGLLTLHRTLSSLSSYPLLVMTTPSLPATHSSLLRSLGLNLIPVSHLSPSSSQHPGFDPSFSRFNDAWTKLQVFGLTEYDKVILIDCDMIFLKDMDELFDLELPGRDWIGASPACVCNPLKLEHYPKDWIPANCSLSLQQSPTSLLSPPIPSSSAPRTAHLLNSGLVILHPSSTILASLIDFINTSPTIAHVKFADQDVIAEAFKGRWRPLPWWCNALKTLRAVHKPLWRDEEVGIIHYILDKPWSARPPSLPPHQPPSPALPPSPASLDGSDDGQAPYRVGPQIRRRPLPSGLLDTVRNSPPQKSLTDYSEVDAWWWIVYEDLLDDLKAKSVDWEAVDKWVTR
ncbi:galactinol synthase [Cryptococcus neoformans var. grubii Br795]|nr:galactinol synthase [Cryptococcus neoformans var. grubii Br795]